LNYRFRDGNAVIWHSLIDYNIIRIMRTKLCTYAKAKELLPYPCSCGLKYGTVQQVAFNPKMHKHRPYRNGKIRVIMRIGHYSPELYKQTQAKVTKNFEKRARIRADRQERKTGRKENKNESKKILKPYGTIWHSYAVKRPESIQVPTFYKEGDEDNFKRRYVSVLKFFDDFDNSLLTSKTFPLGNRHSVYREVIEYNPYQSRREREKLITQKA